MLLNMKKTSIGRICFIAIAVTLVAIMLMPGLTLASEGAYVGTASPWASGDYVYSYGITQTTYVSDYLYAENRLYKVYDFGWYEEYELQDTSWAAGWYTTSINSGYTSAYYPNHWGEKWVGWTYHRWVGESGNYYATVSSEISYI